jgi:hypothetical protein
MSQNLSQNLSQNGAEQAPELHWLKAFASSFTPPYKH